MAAANLSDDQLLARARYAGRNLTVLTTLASLAALTLWGLTFFLNQKAPFSMAIPAVALSLLAAGYWILAIAAYRGNPLSVGIVLVLMGLQMAATFVVAGIAAARTGGDVVQSFSFGRLIIPILVIMALVSSRSVLLELQERGLWERAFANVKPSGHLCVIGGVLVGTAFLSINAGMGFLQSKVTQVRALERKQASEFAQLIKNEEAQFMTAIGDASKAGKPGGLKTVVEKLDALDQKLQTIKEQSSDNARLTAVLATYGNAVRQWRNGLDALGEKKPDTKRANQFLQLGDKLRNDAIRDFKVL